MIFYDTLQENRNLKNSGKSALVFQMEKLLIYQVFVILQIVIFFWMVVIAAFSPEGFTTLNGRLVRIIINPNGMAKGM
jgi:hypothetical protein